MRDFVILLWEKHWVRNCSVCQCSFPQCIWSAKHYIVNRATVNGKRYLQRHRYLQLLCSSCWSELHCWGHRAPERGGSAKGQLRSQNMGCRRKDTAISEVTLRRLYGKVSVGRYVQGCNEPDSWTKAPQVTCPRFLFKIIAMIFPKQKENGAQTTGRLCNLRGDRGLTKRDLWTHWE